MSMLLALRFSPAATLAYVMGAGFIADTASLPLVVVVVVSNLGLHVLARKGVSIGWGYFLKVGVLLTVPVLLVTLAALAVRLSI